MTILLSEKLVIPLILFELILSAIAVMQYREICRLLRLEAQLEEEELRFSTKEPEHPSAEDTPEDMEPSRYVPRSVPDTLIGLLLVELFINLATRKPKEKKGDPWLAEHRDWLAEHGYNEKGYRIRQETTPTKPKK